MENKTPENNNDDNSSEDVRRKHDADSGNDTTNQILQKEKLIDPGNEHNHHADTEKGSADNNQSKFDADAGGDGTGTMGSKPDE